MSDADEFRIYRRWLEGIQESDAPYSITCQEVTAFELGRIGEALTRIADAFEDAAKPVNMFIPEERI